MTNDTNNSGAKSQPVSHVPISASDPPPAAFMCVVYVKSVDGGVRCRVANFGDIEVTAMSERDGVTKLLPLAKAFVQQHHQTTGALPPDEMKEMEPGEQRRRLPAHL